MLATVPGTRGAHPKEGRAEKILDHLLVKPADPPPERVALLHAPAERADVGDVRACEQALAVQACENEVSKSLKTLAKDLPDVAID